MADNSYNIMVSNPVTPFTMSRSFKACSNGKIFIGLPDTDPTFPQNQIPVYVENECGNTVQVPQPIVINSAGYPVYHGQVAKFVTTQNYSMAVYDSYMVQQFYWGDLSKFDPEVYIKDQANTYVSLKSFGVYLQSSTVIGSGAAIDMSDRVNAAIAKAKELNVPLLNTFGVGVGPSTFQHIYVEKMIDISGLKETQGTLNFAILGSKFTPSFYTSDPTPCPVVLKNMNASYDSSGKQYKSTTGGGQQLDTIQVLCLDNNAPVGLIGMMHTTAYTHFRGDFWARRFNGTGIRFANTYDCSFSGHVAVVDSGNVNYYPLQVGSYPYADAADESNTLTFPSILLHSNKYRDASIVGSKINVVRVHGEALTIPDTTGLTANTTDTASQTGIAPFVFGSVGGTISTLDYKVAADSVIQGTCLINMMNTTVSNMVVEGNCHAQVGDIFYLGLGGTVSNLSSGQGASVTGGSKIDVEILKCSGDLYIPNTLSLIKQSTVGGSVTLNASRIDKLTCAGSYTQNQYGSLYGGTIAGMTYLQNSSPIENTTLSGGMTSPSNATMKNLTLAGVITLTGNPTFIDSSFPTTYTLSKGTHIRCAFPGVLKATSTASCSGTFTDCNLAAGFDFTNNAALTVRMQRCAIGGPSTMAGYSGYLIIDPDCYSIGSSISIAGWAKPTSTNAGYGSETINPYAGTGWRLTNSGSAAQWFPVTKFTSS